MKALLIITTLLLCQMAIAQTGEDLLFMNGQKNPLPTSIYIDYKHAMVLYQSDGKIRQKVPFDQVDSIKLGSGKTLTKRTTKENSDLLVELVRGKSSLWVQEDRFMFYIEQNDTLKLINQKHFTLALPVIFGSALMEEFKLRYRAEPSYTVDYFRNVVTFSNEKSGLIQVVPQENYRRIKGSFMVGPYLSFGTNSIAIKPTKTGIKSGYYRSPQWSYGLKAGYRGRKAFDFEIHVYVNSISHHNIKDSIYSKPPGEYGVIQTSKLTSFSSKQINFDGVIKYSFFYKIRRKFSPYVFAGPSFISVLSNKLSSSVRLYNVTLRRESYGEWSFGTDKNGFMVGLNAGLGFDYNINRKTSFAVFVKHQSFIYPTVDAAPPVDTPYGIRFDLYGRSTSAGLTLAYKL
jgi:hypothetical protein